MAYMQNSCDNFNYSNNVCCYSCHNCFSWKNCCHKNFDNQTNWLDYDYNYNEDNNDYGYEYNDRKNQFDYRNNRRYEDNYNWQDFNKCENDYDFKDENRNGNNHNRCCNKRRNKHCISLFKNRCC